MKVPFLGGAYEGRSPNVSSQECVNLYFEPPAKHELNDGALVATPGATSAFAATDAGTTGILPLGGDYQVRGTYVFEDSNPNDLPGGGGRRLFFVIHDRLYELSGGVLVQRGSDLTTTNTRVSIAANNVGQLMLVDGNKGYILEGTVLTEIADVDFVVTDVVVHQDGYFITTEPGSNKFRYSDLLDGTSWNGLSVQSAEGAADTVVSLLSDRRELWVFGDRTTEVYYNSGDPDTPFQRFQNGYIEAGIAAKYSAVKHDNTVVWLGKNDRGQAQVLRADENWLPVVISTPEVNYQLQQYDTIDDAFAYSYQMEGHEFYVITFPTADVTWAYDALTQEWHQRAHTIDDAFPCRERFNCHAFYNNKHYVGDYTNGRVYTLDSSIGTVEVDGTNAAVVPRVRTSPAAFADNESRVRVSEFQLDMEEGSTNGQYIESNVWLSYSKDGGHTWSNETKRSIGSLGNYAHRVIWRKLGWGRNWIMRIRTWSTGRVIIKGAYARLFGDNVHSGRG